MAEALSPAALIHRIPERAAEKTVGLTHSTHLSHLTLLMDAISLPTSLHDRVGAIHWALSERLSVA